jgi:RNA polymerase sigma-70 factor (ECF subfamily)
VELADEVGDPAVGALDSLVEREEHRRLMACLEELAPPQRHAIRTAFLDGWTYERLAAAEGVPLGTMKSWVRRGLMKLRTCLER